MDLPDFLSRTEKGGIRITGYRIELYHIVDMYHEGYSAEMMHGEFPMLPLAVTYEVMAFYLENKAEVDAYTAQVEVRVQKHIAAAKPTPTLGELRVQRQARETAPSL